MSQQSESLLRNHMRSQNDIQFFWSKCKHNTGITVRIVYIAESNRSIITGLKLGLRMGSVHRTHAWRPRRRLAAFTHYRLSPSAFEEEESTFACSHGCRTAPCAYKRACVRLPGRNVTQEYMQQTCRSGGSFRLGKVYVDHCAGGGMSETAVMYDFNSSCQ